MNQKIVPPAELWLGASQELVIQAQQYLQQFFCPHNACTTCKTCSLIAHHQYHAITWLYPEKQYTLSSLEPITQAVSFALEKNQHHFFIIQKADFLSVLCQNMLLKTIEEPPAGYHFIFLAERKEHILPTIQSRCRIRTWYTHSACHEDQVLIQFFTQKTHSPRACLEEIEKNTPHERESIELLDTIIAYWLQEHAKEVHTSSKGSDDTQKKLQVLLRAQQYPPMPGSSKIFWRNLFLQWQQ